MKDSIRRAIQASMRLNEAHVDSVRSIRDALTEDEKALVEQLRTHPAFGSFDKSQLDRHTLKHLFVAISDQPASVCERTASKVEKMLENGTMSDNLVAKKSLTEGEEVPVEKPEIKDGEGELKQGPSDTTASDHEGGDVGKAAKDKPKGDADQGVDQNKDKHGDKSDIAKDGYMSEKEDDDEDDLPDDDDMDEDADGAADAKDHKDPQMGEDSIDTEDPAKAGKAAKDLPEEDEKDDKDDDEDDMDEATPPPPPATAPAAVPAPVPAAPAPTPAPAMKKEKAKKVKESLRKLKERRRELKEQRRKLKEQRSALREKSDPTGAAKITAKMESLKAELKAIKKESKRLKENLMTLKALKEEDVPKDAKDPANDDEHRAANDATYKDGKKQNEAQVNEDDLKQPDETKDASDLPDYDKVQKEDPAGSELNKGPVDPKLESLSAIEERICSILKESGLKKGTPRWVEAYTRGWNLAMEHRARKLSEGK